MRINLNFAVLLGLTILSAIAAEPCLQYGPASVKISGTLVSHEGIRGWWAAKPDRPICMVKDPSDPYAMAHQGVEELQLIIDSQENYNRFRSLLGQKVSVAGTLSPQWNGHHETRVMITVSGIDARDGSAGAVPVQPPSAPMLDVPAYFAAATVVPRPVNRLIKQAWDREPGKFFANSERYIETMFNGPMDTMWAACRSGYSITEAKSSTGSTPFQMDANDAKNPFWGIAVSETGRSNITVRCTRR